MLDAHANTQLAAALHYASPYCPHMRPASDLGGLPTVEIQGPDGEWRRYYVRLTEAAQHAPLTAEQAGAFGR